MANFIDHIEIRNFKSIRHQEINDCRRINLFIGYPKVGKSNILECVGLFSHLLLYNQKFSFNEICRVKHLSELFFNQDYRNALEIVINKSLWLKLWMDHKLSLQLDISRLIDHQGNKDDLKIFGASLDVNLKYKEFNDVPSGNYKDLVAPIKKYEFKKNSLVGFHSDYDPQMPYGNNLLDVIQSNTKLREETVELFDKYDLKLLIDNTDQSIKLIKELKDRAAVFIPYHQVSDTLKRLIFYKAAIISNKGSILLFEEPESHTFPPYISKFTGEIIYDENRNQYFITSHSPFIINDFLEDLKPEDISVYAVGLNKGETTIKRITDDELHEIYQYGIDLFFNLESYLADV